MKITLKASGDEFWDRIANLVGSEEGIVTGSPDNEGLQFFNAIFPLYGEEVSWIPDSACSVAEVSNPLE